MKICAETLFLYGLAIDYCVLSSVKTLWHARGRPFLCAFLINVLYISLVPFTGLFPAASYILLSAAVMLSMRSKIRGSFLGMALTAALIDFLISSITLGLMAVFNVGAYIAALPCFLVWFTVKKADKSIRLSKISGIYSIRLEKDGRFADISALADTGNALYINGRPVVAADSTLLLPLCTDKNDMFAAKCSTVSGESEILCFYADLSVNGKTIKNICAAISAVPINGPYSAVINPELLI